jgi:5-methylcytosine-specific restriction endonuclease McrA
MRKCEDCGNETITPLRKRCQKCADIKYVKMRTRATMSSRKRRIKNRVCIGCGMVIWGYNLRFTTKRFCVDCKKIRRAETNKKWKAIYHKKKERTSKIRQRRLVGIPRKVLLELRRSTPMCPACGQFVEFEGMSLDHIIPLSRGGEHKLSNLSPLCRRCNSRKHDALPKELLGLKYA